MDRPTLNHTHRKPYIPLPPALPRFALPNEASDDALADAAATAQRPALSMGMRPRSRPLVRRKLVADSTEEIQVEDILLEAYVEEPPPPLPRRLPGAPPLPTESTRASIAMAIASAGPPPSQSAAVDALLRASEPAFAPYPLQGQGFVNPQQSMHVRPYGHGPSGFVELESQSLSVAPVMLASTVPPPARPVVGSARGHRANRGVVVALWSTVLLVLSVALGAAVVLGVKNGTYARVRDSARSVAARTSSKATPVAAAAAAPAPADAPGVAPAPVALAPAPAPAPPPTVSVDALASPPIPAGSSLVSFPAYAQGHRVFIDGRVIAVTDGTPTMVKCGRHMVKLGTARKARVLDFACGREVIVK